MQTNTRRTLHAFVGLAALSIGAPAAAQHEHEASGRGTDSTIVLFNNLGPHRRAIGTRSAVAQQYFDQGMRLTYAFGMPAARRSFQAAIDADPRCAMCHWGLAWSLGPYVNGGVDSASEVRAHAAALQARRHARRASAADRALIDAMAVRYDAGRRASRDKSRDSAYATAMRDAYRRFPNDLDVAALFAESLMVLRPWNYWTRGGEPQPGVEELMSVLETALARDLRHPGACHLYIHATEASLEPGRAEACADGLMDAMPGASHMRHMPSHTYMRIGRYGDAVRSNQLAWIADQQAEHGGATAIYPGHNLHMLLFAAAYDGQSGVALQAARDLGRLQGGSAWHLPMVMARFGRWREILELPRNEQAFGHAITAYARGLAYLRTKQPALARMELAGLSAQAGDTTNNRYRRALFGIARAILAAEVARSAGRFDDAITTLEAARTFETDSLDYDEPEEWIVPLRQVLGATLLEAGRTADAEAAYRGELETHPDNGWSLYGLYLALRQQGKDAEAAQVLERFRRAWSRADVDLRGSFR